MKSPIAFAITSYLRATEAINSGTGTPSRSDSVADASLRTDALHVADLDEQLEERFAAIEEKNAEIISNLKSKLKTYNLGASLAPATPSFVQLTPTEAVECSGNGTLDADGGCDCNEAYTGDICDKLTPEAHFDLICNSQTVAPLDDSEIGKNRLGSVLEILYTFCPKGSVGRSKVPAQA